MANSFTVDLTSSQAALACKNLGIPLSELFRYTPGRLLPALDGVQLAIASIVGTVGGGVAVTLEVIKKPFYVSMDVIENHVKALIGG
jgi:hypothetical protein